MSAATPFDIVIIGLSITSSWGNGHATTYRSLVAGLAACGHRVLFLEHDAPWYAENRDQPQPPGAVTRLYTGVDDLIARFEQQVEQSRLVIVGSYVADGIRVGDWVTSIATGHTAFYDIDTPITLAQLEKGECRYLHPSLVRRYDLYLSFTGGPALDILESRYASPMARVLYCSTDITSYRPLPLPLRWDLGYLGTYSEDRQPTLEELLLEPARSWQQGRFAVYGAMYPGSIQWPSNVAVQSHLPPEQHAAFYSAQRFTLNVTRAEMRTMGYSPSVRLFEAGACAVPIVSDFWEGLDHLFIPEEEILIAHHADDTLRYLRDIPEPRRLAIGEAGRCRVVAQHTPQHRARELEGYLREIDDNTAPGATRRDRRHRQTVGRLTTGLAPERDGPAASPAVGPDALPLSLGRHLHQPPAEDPANRRLPGTAIGLGD